MQTLVSGVALKDTIQYTLSAVGTSSRRGYHLAESNVTGDGKPRDNITDLYLLPRPTGLATLCTSRPAVTTRMIWQTAHKLWLHTVPLTLHMSGVVGFKRIEI